MAVEFKDFNIEVKGAINDACNQFLEEAASEIESQAARNTNVDSGQLKGSWTHVVDESAHEATVGSPLEYAIWQEMGTGEYALEGNGRKGGWLYEDKDTGEFVYTQGSKPVRMLHNAFETKRSAVIRRAEQIMKGLG